MILFCLVKRGGSTPKKTLCAITTEDLVHILVAQGQQWTSLKASGNQGKLAQDDKAQDDKAQDDKAQDDKAQDDKAQGLLYKSRESNQENSFHSLFSSPLFVSHDQKLEGNNLN